MLRKLLATLIGIFTVAGLGATCSALARDDIFAVSFYEVLARPAQFERKPIVVAGVISLEFEDVALYPEMGSFNTLWRPDAIDLILSAEQLKTFKPFHGKRVLVQGTFERTQPHTARLGPFGTLNDIVRVRPLEERGPPKL